jgi:hypothetical protein
MMNITLKNGRIEINGKSFFGNHININAGRVVVDGITQGDVIGHVVHVTVIGDCESVENESGNVTVRGVTGSLRTGSGDVIAANVAGGIQTGSGDVSCGTVGGSIRTGSGDVHHG